MTLGKSFQWDYISANLVQIHVRLPENNGESLIKLIHEIQIMKQRPYQEGPSHTWRTPSSKSLTTQLAIKLCILLTPFT